MRVLAVAAALACAACGTVQPYKVVTPTGKSAAEVFNCALGQATGLNYVPDQVNKDSGFFKADHNYSPGPRSIHWGQTLTDQLTILVSVDPTSGKQQLQITGASGINMSRNARLIEPSSDVVAAANQIAATCK